jgi:hypothetical protein
MAKGGAQLVGNVGMYFAAPKADEIGIGILKIAKKPLRFLMHTDWMGIQHRRD